MDRRKKVIAGCIDLTFEFDGAGGWDSYVAGLGRKKQAFRVLQHKEYPDGRVIVRIQKQYNNSPFPRAPEGVTDDGIQ